MKILSFAVCSQLDTVSSSIVDAEFDTYMYLAIHNVIFTQCDEFLNNSVFFILNEMH